MRSCRLRQEELSFVPAASFHSCGIPQDEPGMLSFELVNRNLYVSALKILPLLRLGCFWKRHLIDTGLAILNRAMACGDSGKRTNRPWT